MIQAVVRGEELPEYLLIVLELLLRPLLGFLSLITIVPLRFLEDMLLLSLLNLGQESVARVVFLRSKFVGQTRDVIGICYEAFCNERG